MSPKSPPSQPPSGFIHLNLLSREEGLFYLEMPIKFVATVSLTPLKYLQYLGWCVLGVMGVLEDEQGDRIALYGELTDQGVYYYNAPNDEHDLARAVDLEVIESRTRVSSETTGSGENFCTELLKRDGRCVWSGLPYGVGMHIIPYRRGDEACSRYYSCPGVRAKFIILLQWLQLIVQNRPDNHNLGSITINDVRNGVFGVDDLHNHFFDPRKVAVLKVRPHLLLQSDHH